MWKCASRTIRATFHKGILRCNTVLSTKVPQDKDFNRLLKLAPALIEHFNRYYGFYKNSCGNFSKEKKRKEGAKKNSFLENFDNNVFDALRWGGVFVLGYYLLQPFRRNRLSPNYSHCENNIFTTFNCYKRTLHYFLSTVDIKPFNYVLPEVKAAKGKIEDNEKTTNKSKAEDVKSESENFNGLEKAHQKVLGALSNWMGSQYMQSGKHKKALEYFSQAAEEENAAGIFNLGICHERGLGTGQNFKRAAELYQKAANLGHATAMYNLGVFYAQGLGGVEPNVDHARELFKAAASLGQADAKKALTLEKQTSKDQKGLSVSNENVEEKKDTISFSHLICDELIQEPLNISKNCKVCSFGAENNCDSLDYKEVKMNNFSVGSDSGVLDLSPQNELDVLLT